MNKLKLQEIINNNLRRYVDPMERRMLNVVRLNTHNSEIHEITKTKICYNLIKEGFSFLVEPKLLNNKRPDILIVSLNECLVYEIMNSETDERCDSKEYMGLKIIKVKII